MLTLIVLWLLFCVVHSGLIAVTTTKKLQAWMGDHYRFFRLYYNIFSLVTFVALLFFTYRTKSEPLIVWSGYFLWLRFVLIALAVVILVLGAKSYNLRWMFGLEQIRSHNRLLNKTDEPIVATGIHGMVRHPWYVGVLILLWISDQNTTSLIANGIASIYLVVGTLLEERKLVMEFGSSYRNYQNQVSMLFPWKWLKAATHK